MKSRGKMSAWLSAPLIVVTFGTLLWLERRRPLRRHTVESKLTRDARNLAVAALGAITLRIAEQPVIEPLARLVERRRWGLLRRARLPLWLEILLAVILLDYTLYMWHVLTHRVPLLWRFHAAHHVDLALDASTALRFHFGELLLSVPWRAAQVVLIGATPLSLSVWQTLLLVSILFHHSNVRLPIEAERWLNYLVVTPRMHGIHHSIVLEENGSNWSSGLTLWDRLHGTLRLNVPQDGIVIGVPACRDPEEVGLIKILVMPFGEEHPIRQLPNDSRPIRAASPVAVDRLLP